MNKKFFLYGMIALLGASLFFLGCPTDGGDGEKTLEKTAAEKAAEQVGDDFGAKASVSGSVVTLNDDVSLDKAVTVAEGVTLTVSDGKTLTVTTGGSLTVNGTLSGGTGAKIVVAGTGTVTAGADVFYKEGASLGTVVKGVYTWDTAAGTGSVPGWKQTALDVTDDYSLQETDGAPGNAQSTQSGVSIDSVLKAADGTVTIKLAEGTFDEDYVFVAAGGKAYSDGDNTIGSKWETAAWGLNTAVNPVEGRYGAVNIKGLVSDADGWNNVEIKIHNPSYVFYTDAADIQTDMEAPAADGHSNIVLDTAKGGPYKWIFLSSGDGDPALTHDQVLGTLLYDSGAADQNKTVRLEVTIYDDDAKTTTLSHFTIIIDYSKVGFGTSAS